MGMTVREIAALVGGEVAGDGEIEIASVSSAASGGPDTITFAESEAALRAALASGAGAVIAGREAVGEKPLVRVDRPRLAFVAVAAALHPEDRPAPGVHPAAVVDGTAVLGEGVHVGPHAVVEAGAALGDRAIVGPGCFVGAGARLGADTRLHANVCLYPGVSLGERVVVHCGAVLGADGFGYADGPEGLVKFPQLGTLVVEDDVEIGANTTIDRGALDATVIRAGTKIDNLVQIAHNVEIGEHSAISSQSGIAGSARIGSRVVLGGQVGVGDHVEIEDGAIVGAQGGVPTGKRLPGGRVYWGTPARPIRAVKRRYAQIGRIGRLAKRVEELARRVKGLEG